MVSAAMAALKYALMQAPARWVLIYFCRIVCVCVLCVVGLWCANRLQIGIVTAGEGNNPSHQVHTERENGARIQGLQLEMC